MTRNKLAGEFGPEHTGYMGSALGWLGWDPGAGTVQCAWAAGWPSGTTTLIVALNSSAPSPADFVYQESTLGPVAQQSTSLTIDTSVPVYRMLFPEGDFHAVLRVTSAGLRWYAWSQDASAVPITFGLQSGWQVTMVRQTSELSIPAGQYLSTSFDPEL